MCGRVHKWVISEPPSDWLHVLRNRRMGLVCRYTANTEMDPRGSVSFEEFWETTGRPCNVRGTAQREGEGWEWTPFFLQPVKNFTAQFSNHKSFTPAGSKAVTTYDRSNVKQAGNSKLCIHD